MLKQIIMSVTIVAVLGVAVVNTAEAAPKTVAHQATSEITVRELAARTQAYLCDHYADKWHCSNPYVLRPTCTWNRLPRDWDCHGVFAQYGAGAWNWLKGVLGFHVPHRLCADTILYQNYPLKQVAYFVQCANSY